MVEESGMSWLCSNLELLEMGEGYHPLSGSITGAGDRITEVGVADIWSRLEKVEQSSQRKPVLGDVAQSERREVWHLLPR